ncbi:MAG: hypothetical protein WA432_04655 [Candidatus Babeliaceae bacterium]
MYKKIIFFSLLLATTYTHPTNLNNVHPSPEPFLERMFNSTFMLSACQRVRDELAKFNKDDDKGKYLYIEYALTSIRLAAHNAKKKLQNEKCEAYLKAYKQAKACIRELLQELKKAKSEQKLIK